MKTQKLGVKFKITEIMVRRCVETRNVKLSATCFLWKRKKWRPIISFYLTDSRNANFVVLRSFVIFPLFACCDDHGEGRQHCRWSLFSLAPLGS
jgi:hypothetical protein